MARGRKVATVGDKARRAADAVRRCLHWDAPRSCSGPVVQAHTVSRWMLRRIADDQAKVVCFSPPGGHVGALLGNPLVASRIGVKQASTFGGFCQKHDNEAFAAFEKRPLCLEAETIALLSFRVVCDRIIAEEQYLAAARTALDHGVALTGVRAAGPLDYSLIDVHEQNHRNLQASWEGYSCALRERDYSKLGYWACRLDPVPGAVCCGAGVPWTDVTGRALQPCTPFSPQSCVELHHVPVGGGGAFIAVWTDACHVGPGFVSGLRAVPLDALPAVLLRLCLRYSDRTYISPAWWDSLSHEAREALRCEAAAFVDEPGTRAPAAVGADGGAIRPTWHVSEVMPGPQSLG